MLRENHKPSDEFDPKSCNIFTHNQQWCVLQVCAREFFVFSLPIHCWNIISRICNYTVRPEMYKYFIGINKLKKCIIKPIVVFPAETAAVNMSPCGVNAVFNSSIIWMKFSCFQRKLLVRVQQLKICPSVVIWIRLYFVRLNSTSIRWILPIKI